jgi:hypothetical protein
MELTRAHMQALTQRADLLESECAIKQDMGLTWNGRREQMRGTGQSGGSALDRRLIIEAMAIIEQEVR